MFAYTASHAKPPATAASHATTTQVQAFRPTIVTIGSCSLTFNPSHGGDSHKAAAADDRVVCDQAPPEQQFCSAGSNIGGPTFASIVPAACRRPPVKRILIVEDNEVNRDVLSRRLGRRGYTVILAHDGVQGLAMAQTEAPNLILMDLGLPEIDGWECARRLKADATTKHIPIIALTAHAMVGERQKALEAGCDDFDTKPIGFDGLLEKIERLLILQPA